MTDAIIQIQYSGGEDYFTFYVGSDSDKDTILGLWKDYCDGVDITSENGRLNWVYVATNFMRYVSTVLYSHKEVFELNRVCVIDNIDEIKNDCIYHYILKPDNDLYASSKTPLFDAVNFILVGEK